MIFHALKPGPPELTGTLLDVYGILLHSMQKCLYLSKSKAFLFAALDRHAYAYKKKGGRGMRLYSSTILRLGKEFMVYVYMGVLMTPSKFRINRR